MHVHALIVAIVFMIAARAHVGMHSWCSYESEQVYGISAGCALIPHRQHLDLGAATINFLGEDTAQLSRGASIAEPWSFHSVLARGDSGCIGLACTFSGYERFE